MRSLSLRGRGGPRLGDAAAIGASTLCLVHCLLVPIAIALIPALANIVDLPEALHLWLFVGAMPVSAFAIVAGFRRHGAWLPGAIAVVGIVLIGIGAIAGLPLASETSVTVLGSVLLAIGHLRNWRAGIRSSSRASFPVAG